MRLLARPPFTSQEVYDACVAGLADATLRAKFGVISPHMLVQAAHYDIQAAANQLHILPNHPRGNPAYPVMGAVSKGEFVALYTAGMVTKDKPGRDYYDKIRSSAPLSICPYCGFGHVSTLDHFLSKSRYSSLGVLPTNLIPCCKDCNSGKEAQVCTLDNQIPHPYFENACIIHERWLYARVVYAGKPVAEFYVECPAHWHTALSARMNSYFESFALASRYSVQAGVELQSIAQNLSLLPNNHLRHLQLINAAALESNIAINSWRSTLYAALRDDPYFHINGYESLLP